MASNAVKCSKCGKATYPADRCERYEGKVYHSGCFKCSYADCGVALTSKNVKGFNKMPYCKRHPPNEQLVDAPLVYETSSADKSNINATPSSLDKSVEKIPLNIQHDLPDISTQHSLASPICLTNRVDKNTVKPSKEVRKEMQSILFDAKDQMVDDIFNGLSKDTHIIVCGSPRVGKSTLINAICGREVAEAREGLASVTHSISSYTMEGECHSESGPKKYKYNFWDTPGFESWEKDDIRSKMKSIIEEPDAKPICMIFCASPSTWVDLTQLEWLLDKCIIKKHIFCALVCTNKYAGQLRSRRAVLESFNKLLSKYVDTPPREANDITFYGNIGLCASVNSEPYELDDNILPKSGINELIYGITESLVDEHVLNWCLVVLENKGFWDNYQQKVTSKFKAVTKFLDWRSNKTIKVKKSNCTTK
ncbi:unnamed protein product [Adineta steineri]|uniref:LIM zinc-binding domain-containing protein n=1 Tax=Adineta steineri TaxID=433720 RepID=A0A813T6V8_9BILA|nr:unnamed protein product [Adineta steineri]CAF4092693.1 unnamed protein product [Adineta steineri]